MFLLVPPYPGSPGPKAIKRLCVCVCVCTHVYIVLYFIVLCYTVYRQLGTNLVIPGGARVIEAKGRLIIPGI